MEKLPLHKANIARLIDERFPGKRAAFYRRAGLHKSTLGRWYEGAHAPRPDRFLRFCGALDADFFALLDVSPEQVASFAYGIAQAALSNTWSNSFPTFSFLQQFLLGPGDWPAETSDGMLAHYSQSSPREWCVWEYKHDPAKGPSECYATFQLKFSADPQVWYFGFQERHGREWMWMRYGCVRKLWEEVLLLNFVFMGEIERVEHPPNADAIVVQTYLGPRPITYRIVSLHPFTATCVESPPESLPHVRFRQPGAA